MYIYTYYIYTYAYIFYIYIYTYIYIYWQSSAPGVLSTLVTSVVFYLLSQATLMSPGKDKICVCVYIYIYIYIIYIYIMYCISKVHKNKNLTGAHFIIASKLLYYPISHYLPCKRNF